MKRRWVLKAVSAFLICSLMLLSCLTVFASPDSLPADVVSTKEGLITLCTPENSITSTTSDKIALSAIASPGTIVTVYRYDYNTASYQKVFADDAPIEASVGASWLFATQLNLQQGMNQFIIRGAWDDHTYSVTKFDVNLLNLSFMDRVKGIISVFFNN